MSQFARRVYYLSAFLIFAVVAPLLLAWTSGYRWANLRSGFVRTGAVAVFSSPKATLYLNNEAQGSTPIRLTHLTPGSYTLELRKSGYRTWSQPLRVTPNVAQVVGPVFLYPEKSETVSINVQAFKDFLISSDQQTIFGLSTTVGVTTATAIWPVETTPTVFPLPFVPNNVSVSPDRQTTIWQTTERTAVISKNALSDPWELPAVSSVTWDPASASIFYGIQLSQAIRYDVITRQPTDIGEATSIVTVGDQVWLTATVGTTTAITRKNSFGQLTPTPVTTLIGDWVFMPNLPQVAVVQNTQTKEAIQLTIDPISNQVVTTSFSTVDALWWTDRGRSPIWLNGSDLLSLDDQRQPTVIDRLTSTPSLVDWVDPGNIIALSDDQGFRILSISNRQGRGVLFEKSFTTPSHAVTLNTNKKTILIQTKAQLPTFEEWQW